MYLKMHLLIAWINWRDSTGSVSTSLDCVYIRLLFWIFERVYFIKLFLDSNSRNHSPELAIYLDAELQVVESELLSLQKVMVKLQSEMKEAMDTKG